MDSRQKPADGEPDDGAALASAVSHGWEFISDT